MRAWRWINAQIAYAVHDRQIAEHGGPDGLRDRSFVDAALARPQNLAAYGTPDAAGLAAAYAVGIARNHPFVDGNKRTAWILARLFLADNGFVPRVSAMDAVNVMVALAAGGIAEDELAAWFRERLPPISG